MPAPRILQPPPPPPLPLQSGSSRLRVASRPQAMELGAAALQMSALDDDDDLPRDTRALRGLGALSDTEDTAVEAASGSRHGPGSSRVGPRRQSHLGAELQAALPRGHKRAPPPEHLAKGAPMSKQRRLLVQRLRRREEQLAASRGQAAAAQASVASAWNHRRLRCGDRLRAGALPLRRQRAWRHPNAWTPEGCVSAAFQALGQVSQRATGARETRRDIDAVGTVALAFRTRQQDNIDIFRLRVKAPNNVERPEWLVVERAFDCTPLRVRFGQLQQLLAPQARYWARDPEGAWKLLSFADYSKRAPSGTAIKSGTLELLAETGRVTWARSGAEQPAVETLLFCPSFLRAADASTLLAALERLGRAWAAHFRSRLGSEGAAAGRERFLGARSSGGRYRVPALSQVGPGGGRAARRIPTLVV